MHVVESSPYFREKTGIESERERKRERKKKKGKRWTKLPLRQTPHWRPG